MTTSSLSSLAKNHCSWTAANPIRAPTVVSYLRSVDIRHLNGVIAAHPDADHIEGLVDVLKFVPVDKVYDLGLAKSTTTYEKLL